MFVKNRKLISYGLKSCIVMTTLMHHHHTFSDESKSKTKAIIPDCATPACSSTMNNLSQAFSSVDKKKKVVKGEKPTLKGCPINTIELGRSAWNVIHTLAEHISEEPDEEEQQYIKSFMKSFSMLYPCHVCRVGNRIWL